MLFTICLTDTASKSWVGGLSHSPVRCSGYDQILGASPSAWTMMGYLMLESNLDGGFPLLSSLHDALATTVAMDGFWL